MQENVTLINDIKRGIVRVPHAPAGVLICDIDGTIAEISHRLHFIQKTPKDWDSFFAACAQDGPIFELIIAVRELALAGWKVVYCTGRRNAEREMTLAWLAQWGLPRGSLMMRGVGDRRPDTEVKQDMLSDLRRNGIEPTLVIEDRARVVEMWRANGIDCLQVREGDY